MLASPSLVVPSPGERFWPLFRDALAEGRASGNLAFDAQVTALCREGGASALLTEDRDFDRFRSLRVVHL